MPKKTSQKSETKQQAQPVRKNAKRQKEPEPIVEAEENDEDVETEPEVPTPVVKRTKKAKAQTPAGEDAVPKVRFVPTRDSVEKEFEGIIGLIDEEISKLRETAAKAKGVKFLRSIRKRLNTLKSHALRVSKQKPTTRRNNTNSGFLKPVAISKELADFTGWDPAQLRSRVEVTKYICNHIKTHNLQDPEDKRRILVDSDPGLKNLLKYNAKDGKPLTYYTLQTYLKGHFVTKDQAAAAAGTTAAVPAQKATIAPSATVPSATVPSTTAPVKSPKRKPKVTTA